LNAIKLNIKRDYVWRALKLSRDIGNGRMLIISHAIEVLAYCFAGQRFS